MARLSENGKPMRALRALAGTNPAEPLTEHGVWRVTRQPESDTTTWHAALATLVAHGLAARTGRRGGYEWYITDAGHEALR